jgi:hypothetical protein
MKIEAEIHKADLDKILEYLEYHNYILENKLENGKNVNYNTMRIEANEILLDIFKGAKYEN